MIEQKPVCVVLLWISKYRKEKSMKYAIVDIGSNTIRMVMYRVFEQKLEYLLNSKIMAKLANYIEESKMKIEGVTVLIDAINQHKELASHHSLDNITFFATASLRVTNAKEVLAAVKEATGETINILTGEQEALCGVSGISYNFDISNCICMDLGGGSLEVSMIKEGKIENAASLQIGSVSLTKKIVSGILPTKSEIADIKDETMYNLETVDWLKDEQFDIAYAVGGSARSMMKMHRVFEKSSLDLHGYRLFASDVHGVYNKIVEADIDGIRLIDQHCPGRLFTFVPGLIVLQTALEYADIPLLRLSQYGVREGYLLNYVV
jgi:exopolyphosphatase / guanosine-5'-triphosphate,3'-diphosphate pyrophosphatase